MVGEYGRDYDTGDMLTKASPPNHGMKVAMFWPTLAEMQPSLQDAKGRSQMTFEVPCIIFIALYFSFPPALLRYS